MNVVQSALGKGRGYYSSSSAAEKDCGVVRPAYRKKTARSDPFAATTDEWQTSLSTIMDSFPFGEQRKPDDRLAKTRAKAPTASASFGTGYLCGFGRHSEDLHVVMKLVFPFRIHCIFFLWYLFVLLCYMYLY